MNKQQAQNIDRRRNLLPGDQGEHDFCVAHDRDRIDNQLIHYASECGGLCRVRTSYTDLHAAWGNSYRLYFAADGSRCIKVDVFDQNGNLHPYWDEKHKRKISYHYQTSNVNEPLLEDTDNVL